MIPYALVACFTRGLRSTQMKSFSRFLFYIFLILASPFFLALCVICMHMLVDLYQSSAPILLTLKEGKFVLTDFALITVAYAAWLALFCIFILAFFSRVLKSLAESCADDVTKKILDLIK